MALYHTDFGDDTIGSPPAGWSTRWGTSGWGIEVVADASALNGRSLQLTKGGSYVSGPWRGLAWDQIDLDPQRGSMEVLILMRATAAIPADNQTYFGAVGRGAGTQGDESFVAGTFYTSQSSPGVQVVRRVGGNAQRSTAVGIQYAWGQNEWWWLRLRCIQQDFFVRFWPKDDPEPEGWSVTRNDEAIPSIGWVGIGAFNPGTYWVDQITVSTLEPSDWGIEPALPIG